MTDYDDAKYREATTRLDAAIARGPGHDRYPRSVRHHGQWVDGRVRPVVPLNEMPSMAEHFDQIKREDRRALALVLIGLALVVATIMLLLPGGTNDMPARNLREQRIERCEIMRQVAVGWGDVDCVATVDHTRWGR